MTSAGFSSAGHSPRTRPGVNVMPPAWPWLSRDTKGYLRDRGGKLIVTGKGREYPNVGV